MGVPASKEDVGQRMAGLLFCDQVVLKAKGATYHQRNLAIERTLFQALAATYLRRARSAIKGAVEATEGGKTVEEVQAGIKVAFDGWGDESEPLFRAAAEESMRLGKMYVLNRYHGAIASEAYNPPAHMEVEKAKSTINPVLPSGFGWMSLSQKLDVLGQQGIPSDLALGWMKSSPMNAKKAGLFNPKVLGDMAPEDWQLLGVPDPHAGLGDKFTSMFYGWKVGGMKLSSTSLGMSVYSDIESAQSPDELAAALEFAGFKSAALSPPGKPPKPGAKPAGGPKKGAKLLEIKPAFDVVDKAAVEALVKHQTFWVGTFYDKKLQDEVATVTSNVLVQSGLGRREAGKALGKAFTTTFGLDLDNPKDPTAPGALVLPKGWKGTAIQYLEGLAANTATVARTTGAMQQFTELDIATYEIINPEDERTCRVCRYMASKEFKVTDAMSSIGAEQAVKSPENVKDLHPWIKADKLFGSGDKGGHGFAEKMGKGSEATSMLLASKGFSYPPFHYKCRCSVDMSADSVFEPEPVKLPEAPKPPPPPPPPPPPVAPATPAAKPGPTPGAGPSAAPAHSAVTPPGVFPWAERELKLVPKSLSGAHEKYLYKDPDGVEWLFKPQQDFQTAGDVMTARVAQAIGYESADFYAFTAKGRGGSIQRMFTGVVGDVSSIAPEALAAEQALEIQKGQVFDWLISQHDTHHENILRTADGKLKFIDKGQTFRFFGKDKLEVGYNPNPIKTYYNKFWEGYISGRDVKVASLDQLDDFLKTIEGLSDEEYGKLLRPYAKAAVDAVKNGSVPKMAGWMGSLTEDDFIQQAISRKHSIRADFQAFYKSIDLRRSGDKRLITAFKKSPAPPAAAVKVPPSGRDWKLALSRAEGAGWRGVPVSIGGTDWESMHAMLYGVEGDGTWLEGKLRAEADRKLSALLGIKAGTTTPATPTFNDPFWNDILTGIKHFNHHFKPGADQVLNPAKVEAFKKVVAQVNGAVNASLPLSPNVKEAAQHYKQIIDAYWDGQDFKKGALNTMVEQFKPPVPKAAPLVNGGLPPGWKMERVTIADDIKRDLPRGGKITAAPGKPEQSLADHYASGGPYSSKQNSPAVKLTAPDGTVVFYRPISTYRDAAFAEAGRIRVMVDSMKVVTPERLDLMMAQLSDLGIATAKATPQDMEMLYLRKVAYKEKLDHLALQTVPESLPIQDQINGLKSLLEKEAHISFPKGYNYMPELDGGDHGKLRWMAHYITPDEASKVEYMHGLTNGDSPVSFFKKVLESKTDDLISTTEKMRIGLPPGGMSPEADLESGGAAYTFTRAMKAGTGKAQLIFRGDLFKDLDAISYPGDFYGNTKSRLDQRIARKEQMSRAVGVSSNETIFKDSLSLNRWLKTIYVTNRREKDELISVFKAHGFKEYAGQSLEVLIQVK